MEKYIITDKIINRVPYIKDSNYDFLKDEKIRNIFDINTIINVLNYIQYDNINFLEKNKYSNNYNLFKYFGCYEKSILDIINDDNFKEIKRYHDIDNMTNMNRELFNYIKRINQTLLLKQNIKNNMFSYMNINDKFRNYLEKCIFIQKYVVKNIDELIEIQNNEEVFNLEVKFEFKFDSGVFLPPNLVVLEFKYIDYGNRIPPNFLPQTIKILIFEYYFCDCDKVLKDVFPKNLKVLDFGDSCLPDINKGTFPDTLEKINLGLETNVSLKKLGLPDNIKTLILGRYHDVKINKGELPKKLENLILGEFYNHEFEKDVLPKTLKYIEINEAFQYTDKLKEYYPDIVVDY